MSDQWARFVKLSIKGSSSYAYEHHKLPYRKWLEVKEKEESLDAFLLYADEYTQSGKSGSTMSGLYSALKKEATINRDFGHWTHTVPLSDALKGMKQRARILGNQEDVVLDKTRVTYPIDIHGLQSLMLRAEMKQREDIRAVLGIAWLGAMRINEALRLQWHHVLWHGEVETGFLNLPSVSTENISIWLEGDTKTDEEEMNNAPNKWNHWAKGRWIWLEGGGPILRRWHNITGARRGPIFPNPRMEANLNAFLKEAQGLGSWPEDFSLVSHGLRIGKAQDMESRGYSYEDIRRQGRWSVRAATLRKTYLTRIPPDLEPPICVEEEDDILLLDKLQQLQEPTKLRENGKKRNRERNIEPEGDLLEKLLLIRLSAI